ncbi:MAG: hypothetical protein WD075_03200 [Rhodospirillales bacterium]
MSTLNTTNTLPAGNTQGGSLLRSLSRFPARIINALYALQDAGKTVTTDNPSFLDLSPTRGDGQTDYAKPFWKR